MILEHIKETIKESSELMIVVWVDPRCLLGMERIWKKREFSDEETKAKLE